MRSLLIAIIATLVIPLAAFAAGGQTVRPVIPGGTMLPGANTASLSEVSAKETGAWLSNVLFARIAKTIISWGSAIAVVAVIFGAYQYLTALGNDEQIGTAHKTITWALGGLGVMLFAFAAVQIVVNLDLGPKGQFIDGSAVSGGASGGKNCTDADVVAALRLGESAGAKKLATTCSTASLNALNRQYGGSAALSTSDIPTTQQFQKDTSVPTDKNGELQFDP